MNKKILFLGGAYAQIPIIQEAKNRGWFVVTCDYLPENPGHKIADEYYNVSTTDYEGVLNLALKIKPDFVHSYASDPAAPIAAYVSEKLRLPGNSYESVKILGEKDLFRKFLVDNSFNAPKSVTLEINDDTKEIINYLNFPVIVKPTDSSGSKGVIKISESTQLLEAINYAMFFSRSKKVIIEEYIEKSGPQLHGDGFVVNGKLEFMYLGDHHYNTKINPFVPYSTTWPSSISENKISLVKNEIDKAIKLSGFKNGAINIEVRLKDRGDIYIMEIGPRSGGNFVPQVIKHATGFDAIKATLDMFENIPTVQSKTNKEYAAYYVLHSETDGILKNIEIKSDIKSHIIEYHQYIKTGDTVKAFQGANAAIGILLLKFKTRKEMDYYISNMNQFIIIQIESD